MIRISDDEVKLMVDSWNAHQRKGTAVRILLDDGSVRKTKTRSEVWMEGPVPVVALDGICGGYLLFRVAVDW